MNPVNRLLRLVARNGATARPADNKTHKGTQAIEHGYTGILVLSGEATMEDVRTSEVEPDLIFDSVKDMIPFL